MAKRYQGVRSCSFCGATPLGATQQKFCSVTCSNRATNAAKSAQPNGRKGRTCALCGVTFDANNAEQQVCSRACKSAHSASRPEFSRVYFPACKGCGQVFAARSSRSAWCSNRCRVADASARVTSFYALACDMTEPGKAAAWRRTLVGYLVERDGSKCGICRRKVDVALPSGPRGDGDGPSIDHIVPRSQGGSDDLANLRLTHWRCNRARRTAGGNEQLALVG